MSGTITGGKRDRMILESILRAVEANLTSLNWFQTGRQHAPITVIDAFPSDNAEVPINTIAFSYGDTFSETTELGSKSEEHYANVYIDFFCEGDALGRHVIGDVYAFLKKTPVLDVYDYDLVTPVVDFQVYIVDDSVEKRLPTRATNPWQKHWHICSLAVHDDRPNS